MGAQIIKRVVGEIPEIIDVCGNNTQVSYNSYGHIAIRYFNSQNDDTLIVFDKRTSDIICNFILENIRAPRNVNYDEVPF
jgi:hypothetical protein